METVDYSRMMENRKAGEKSLRKGDYTKAEESFLAALREAETAHQPNAYTIHQLKTIGVFFFALGRLPEAENYLSRALTQERLLLGAESLEICSSLNLIGLLYHVMQDYSRAESAYREALEIQEKAAFAKVPKANTKIYHMSLHHLAMVYCFQRRIDDALEVCRQASDRIGNITGPGGRNLAIDFQNIAVNCCAEGHETEALETCQWMLDLCFQELQREFLKHVIGEGGLGRIGFKPSHLPSETDALANLYREAWRPAPIYRQDKGSSRSKRAAKESSKPSDLPAEHEDYWRP
ncbi:MAG: Tetratricopeptide repeat protein [Candidatus Hinthialibacteria bacterium OLB16]|nr:MAG: Tetratricopeptide repeat protein [Candidatus Hinthialibacteria bacterium OLB16]